MRSIRDCLARLDVLKGGAVRGKKEKKKEEKTIVVETGAWLLSQPSENTPRGAHQKFRAKSTNALKELSTPLPAKDSALSRETES